MMSKIDLNGDGGISIDDFVEFNAKWVHILIQIFSVYIKNFRNQFAGNFPVEDSVKDQVMLLFTNKYLYNAQRSHYNSKSNISVGGYLEMYVV